jgi:valyl-tRNA synthetase
VKPQLASGDREVALAAWRNIFAALDSALRLLHPVMPFLTEELWHKLPQPDGARSIALDKFPEPRKEWQDTAADDAMTRLQDIVVTVRNIRAEMKIDANKKVAAEFSARTPMLRHLLEDNLDPVLRLATLSSLRVTAEHLDPQGAIIRSTAAFDLRIAFSDIIDKPAEIARLKKAIDTLKKDIASKQARLADENFTSKAPGHVVDALRATMMERQLELRKLEHRLHQLEES